jgi:uncharacterized protein YegP (UPF0339 family)
MSNSSLATIKVPANTRNYTKGRNGCKIEKITIHHMAGVATAEACGKGFQAAARKASSHYGIGKNGEIGLYVDEENAAWTDGNFNSNCKSVTIETSNSATNDNWPVSDKVLESLIKLVADIAKRNKLGKLVKGKNVTWHSMYDATVCPGPYLLSKMDYICEKANEINEKSTNTNKTTTSTTTSNKTTSTNSKSTTKTIYKVQTGAYKSNANATKAVATLKSKGFTATVIKVYDNYKVQIGAYSKKANAENMVKKLKSAGIDSMIVETTSSTTTTTTKTVTFKVGDKVTLKANAPIYGKKDTFADWVYTSTLYVREIDGSRIVISTQKTGAITGAVDKKYLTKK